ncbi:tetratricopeptide repeat protein 39c-like protein [Lasius niger]|uniref:Tetratricopeptide repeat protein 39c-like protein n=1 Tax=Lasius niger TaxID=67767 RepID=A0A0J7KNU6_LASNI|nr:tetratricopeptide repeat protein 39c-like protein [Lasius niger]
MIKSDLGNLRTHLETLSLEVKNVMEMRDELKSKLKEVGNVIPKMSEAILNLRNEVSEGKKEMNLHTKNLLKALSPETVKNMVRNELQTYDADKTGRTDYALESSGETATAPRDFSIWGLTDLEDEKPFSFGTFTYDNTGPPLQYFEIQVEYWILLLLINVFVIRI